MSNTILAIHGNSSSSRVYEPLKNAINGCEFLAPDLPGHAGHKSQNPERDYSIAGLRQFILDQIGQKEDYYLIGNSIGGHLILDLLPNLNGCKGVFALGTPPLKKPPNFEEAFLPWPSASFGLKGDATKEELDFVVSEIAFQKEAKDLFRSDFENTDPEFREVMGQSLMGGDLMDEYENVSNSTIPVFVIHGLNDPAVNLDYIKTCPGIRGILELAECGHYPTKEQPENVIKWVQEQMGKMDELG